MPIGFLPPYQQNRCEQRHAHPKTRLALVTGGEMSHFLICDWPILLEIYIPGMTDGLQAGTGTAAFHLQ